MEFFQKVKEGQVTNAGLKEFLACAIDNRIVILLDD